MKMKFSLWLPIGLLIVFAITRWPGLLPQNFSAAYALLCGRLFSRATGRYAWHDDGDRRGDEHIGLPRDAGQRHMLVNYATYAAVVAARQRFSSHSSWLKLVGQLLARFCFTS